MQVNTSNDVKIYNLSAGKSLPDWLTDRKRRQMEKSDVNVRRRIELLQDFDMPEVSTSVKVSLDGQYIMAAGAYKPRVRCFDTAEMSMKFERCMDSEIVKFLILSTDYTKMVFLHSDRYVELHAQYGKYYRVRVPKFGRDLAYLSEHCHLYVVGASREIYRLNLEEGKFMPSLITSFDTEINTCDVNPVHQLFVCGTTGGHVEAFDPRSGKSEGFLNCNLPELYSDGNTDSSCSVTKVKFKDSLNLAVGTSTGHVLLYDIRSPRPYYTKDHNYGLPIKAIEFLPDQDLIASIDTKILKIWERQSGKAVTSVEPGTDLNDLCVVPNSGMMFLANEAPKILTYFIPSIGPAPRWCSFLDSLTEEMEETSETVIYDDYKFLTADELETLGLADLIGTNLLRAYMHGFFVDVRLYKKAKSIVEPFNYDDYRKQKIREKLTEEQSESRVPVEKLPKVNAALARKFLQPAMDEKSLRKAKLVDSNPLQDERFQALFKNPDFQVDPASDEYRLLNPLVSKMDRRRLNAQSVDEEPLEEDPEEEWPVLGDDKARDSSDSSEDDRDWIAERKKQHKMIREEKSRSLTQLQTFPSGRRARVEQVPVEEKAKSGVSKTVVKTLGKRLEEDADLRGDGEEIQLAGGNRQMTFTVGTARREKAREESALHHAERRQLHRSGRPIESRLKKPWKGNK